MRETGYQFCELLGEKLLAGWATGPKY